MEFSELVGQELMIVSKFLDESGAPRSVKVCGVEPGGLWIQDEHLENLSKDILKRVKDETGVDVELLFFLPFHRVEMAIHSRPRLSEPVDPV